MDMLEFQKRMEALRMALSTAIMSEADQRGLGPAAAHIVITELACYMAHQFRLAHAANGEEAFERMQTILDVWRKNSATSHPTPTGVH